jgi:glycosyltransferase involved in cell wall biosynthesis
MAPLFTFAIVAFQQERFIAEAVEGALTQTYSPLEVILSDDVSRDRTFDIMQEMAARYRGPHKVILNREARNLGLARHVNRVQQLARGELVVLAAGDDISLPRRTDRIFEAWDNTGRSATFFHSRVIHIDDHGKEIVHPTWHNPMVPTHKAVAQSTTPSHYVQTLHPEVLGCSTAFNSDIFRLFGGLPQDAFHEDNTIAFRSVLLGGMLFIDTPLVKYRLHGGNAFNARHGIAATLDSIQGQERRLQRNFTYRASMYRSFCLDLLAAREGKLISEEEFLKAYGAAKHWQLIRSLQSEFMGANGAQKARLLVQLARSGATPAEVRKLLLRMLPVPVFQLAKLVRGRWLNRSRLAGPA